MFSAWERGIAFWKGRNFDMALKEFKSCDPSPKIHFNLAIIHINKKEYVKAIKCLTNVIHLRWPIHTFIIGNCLCGLELWEDALIWYERSLKEFRQYKEIDYTPLGLNCKLESFDLYMNMFIAHEKAGFDDLARNDLLIAKMKYPGRLRNFPRRIVDIDCLFQPPTGLESSPISAKSIHTLIPKSRKPSDTDKNENDPRQCIPLASSSPVYCK
eukprot:NODE_438_length_7412_cov_0.582798.p6 type:complete len:213 gc:universal NODE_438_length_7412_cov_0.582798:4685-5323(+)